MSNAQFALLAAAWVAVGKEDNDQIQQRALMFKMWLDQQDKTDLQPAADKVELPQPLTGPPEDGNIWCDVCGHPWGYHHAEGGCSMPVIPGTHEPITYRDFGKKCDCTITGRVRDDA